MNTIHNVPRVFQVLCSNNLSEVTNDPIVFKQVLSTNSCYFVHEHTGQVTFSGASSVTAHAGVTVPTGYTREYNSFLSSLQRSRIEHHGWHGNTPVGRKEGIEQDPRPFSVSK
jgi:hypothetical protein